MPFVKAIVWVAFAIILVLFAVNNWVPVTIALWGDLLLDTKLPVLIIGAFLAGMIPMWVWHKGSRWRMRRQITQLQDGPVREPFNMAKDPYAPPKPRSQTPKQETGGLESVS